MLSIPRVWRIVTFGLEIKANGIQGINHKPGLLALAMEKFTNADGKPDMRGYPFVVPGGRFNELYGMPSFLIFSRLCAHRNRLGQLHDGSRAYLG